MLHEISIENVGIFARAQLSLGPGLTAITGETGAGKSLVVNSIELALGGRADTSLVRSGASKAVVEAVFDVSDPSVLGDIGTEPEEGSIYVQRELAAEGKSQSRINGKLTPVSILKKIGEKFADLHGQHENQTIMNAANHLDLLDCWIGESARKLRKEISGVYRLRSTKAAELAALEDNERNRAREIDLISFQVEEIKSVGPQNGEYERLAAEAHKLKNIERLRELLSETFDALYAADDSGLQKISQGAKLMVEAASIAPNLAAAKAAVEQAKYEAENAAAALREAASTIQGDSSSLDSVEQRIAQLQSLRRKYGSTEAEIIEFLATSEARLDQLTNFEESRTALEQEVSLLTEQLTKLSSSLTAIRKQQADKFSTAVLKELSDLAMGGSKLSVRIEPKELCADGGDSIEFLFSANKGESVKALSKIASGGELSRLTLAIKSVMADLDGPHTLIFDEVDAGLGGEAAIVLGRKLAKLAEKYQVIVITHLPQVAAFAPSHCRIQKSETGGRTVAVIEPLDHIQRVDELARMLAGEGVASHAKGTAEELLASAGNSTRKAHLG
ncbi:MAG: DNA repair protein RecN [Fimbriimonadales bacterium]